MSIRTLSLPLVLSMLFFASATFTGCKPDEETKTKLADFEKKAAENSKKISDLESDLKKTNFELSQIKDVVTKIGNVAVELQKAEEVRQKTAAAKPAAKAKPAAGKSKAAPKGATKKHH